MDSHKYFTCAAVASILATLASCQSEMCAGQPALTSGNGPVAIPDTVQAFYDLPAINSAATSALVPTGYTAAYTNLHAMTSGDGYQGHSLLDVYDVSECASRCDLNDPCIAFNVAFERAPSREPSAADGPCPQPPSTTLIKCVLWSSSVSAGNAVNTGQLRGAFEVVVAGSNGYNKVTPPTPPGFAAAVNLGKRALAPPTTCNDGVRTGIRQIFLSASNGGDPLNVTYCAGWCDREFQLTKKTCYFFNSYWGRRINNGADFGQVCDMYTLPWGKEYATKTHFSFEGALNSVESSFSFMRTNASSQCAAAAPSSS